MATLTLDTHAFIERLRGAGMPDAQARAIIDGLREIDLGGLATKEDIVRLEGLVNAKSESLKAELLKWLVPILLGQAGLIVALVRLL